MSLLLLAVPAFGLATKQESKDCPTHAQHATRQTVVESNGDRAMGFPHDRTTHHFRMATDGGAIEVTAKDPAHEANTTTIRSHLSHIAMMFSNGDFSTPVFIHDGVPPGVTTMKLIKSAIHYKDEEMPTGWKVWINSGDPNAVAAIHDFLRFQITEHQTGDSPEVATR